MPEKCFCPYCGLPLSENCDCEFQVALYKEELLEALEDRQLENAWQQDVIDLYRYER